MSDLKQKWSALKNSERNLIIYGSVFVVISISYFYVWQPYNLLINNYRQQILYTQEDIGWLKQVSVQIKQIKSGSSAKTGSFSGSFINTIDKSIKQNRLHKFVSTLEKSGGDKVVVQFNKVSFNTLIKWASYIKTRYGVVTKNIDLKRDDNMDLINARIILKKI